MYAPFLLEYPFPVVSFIIGMFGVNYYLFKEINKLSICQAALFTKFNRFEEDVHDLKNDIKYQFKEIREQFKAVSEQFKEINKKLA